MLNLTLTIGTKGLISKHSHKQDQSLPHYSVVVLSVIPVTEFLQNNDIGQCLPIRSHVLFSWPSEQSVNCSPMIPKHAEGSAQCSEFVLL
jgi:hypothetical protein